MTFGTLAVLVAAGMVGPLLASVHRAAPPAVVGEIIAGLIIGASGLRWVDPADPTLQSLAAVGFAMLMFVVGTHLPFRDPRLRPALGRGALTTVTTAGLALGAGWLIAPHLGLHRPLVLAVLLTASSAAVSLPLIQADRFEGSWQLVAISWIAIADVATVLAIPLVLSTGQLGRAVTGTGIVLITAGAIYFVTIGLARRPVVLDVRAQSKARGWALDLRTSLLVLFVLAWIATRFGTSILIAGFSAGAVVSLVGEPRRVAQQLIGVAEGFFVPLFFVDLGARLDIRALLDDARSIALAATLTVAATAVHVTAGRLWRVPLGPSLVATAQLGVPAAVASIGLQTGALRPAQAAAVMAAALGTLAICAIGSVMIGHSSVITDHAAPMDRSEDLGPEARA